jgi:hypothetical protein
MSAVNARMITLAGDVAGAIGQYEALLGDQRRVLGPDHPETLTTRSNLAYFRALAGDPAGVIAELEALLTGPRGVRPSLVKTSVRWHCTVCGETKSHVALSYWVGLRATRRHTTVGSVDVGDGAIQARTRRRVMSSARVHNHA